jgi:hypothetical protein
MNQEHTGAKYVISCPIHTNSPKLCQVQLLKHTVTQVFHKSDWDEAICMVNKVERGFKVGIAFEFDNYVLAFLTLDLLIQASFLSKSASKFVLQLGAVSLVSRARHPCHSA